MNTHMQIINAIVIERDEYRMEGFIHHIFFIQLVKILLWKIRSLLK